LALTLLRRGAYNGRLAFDPDSEFHTDEKGRKVVTLDGGKTWRYARRSHSSHNARYQRKIAVIDTTANAQNPEPHHLSVQPHDDHYDPTAPNLTTLKSDPDEVAVKVTSHTEAWS